MIRKRPLPSGVCKVCVKDGRPVAVLRTRRPAVSLAIASAALKANDGEMLDRGLRSELEEEGATFVGWLSEDPPGFLLDENLHAIGEPEAGDHFVTLNDEEPRS